MYNLIVSGDSETWNDTHFELERDRVASAREYTVDEIAERYKKLDARAIAELQSFPTLFAYERGCKLDAHIGYIGEIRLRGNGVGFEFGFYDGLPTIPPDKLETLVWALDINPKGELYRTHWAVKDVDLMPSLVDAGIITVEQAANLPPRLLKAGFRQQAAQLMITPQVFRVVDPKVEMDLASVMMPFDAQFNPVYVAIQDACTRAKLRCLRVDDVWEDSTVIQDIFSLLVRSRVVVSDFSGRNSNVMYETGIAHTLGRPVIPMTQSIDHVPYDLRHHRVLTYLSNEQGLADMTVKLTDRLKTLIA